MFHSYLLILKQQTCKCKRKLILCQFRNILAMSLFETLGKKLKVLSIFCGTNINLKWIIPPPPPPHPPPPQPFLDLPPHFALLTHPLILKSISPQFITEGGVQLCNFTDRSITWIKYQYYLNETLLKSTYLDIWKNIFIMRMF